MTCDLLWVATGLVSSLHGFGVRGSRPNSTWPPHPEPRTRFQRVKRGMNRGHAGCCKQGVAGGVLVAIMVVGSRSTTQWCFEPVEVSQFIINSRWNGRILVRFTRPSCSRPFSVDRVRPLER